VSARDLLAGATPRPWRLSAQSSIDSASRPAWSIADAGDPDRALIVAAVNEYEALLDLEECWRAFLADDQIETTALEGHLARLDAVRSGA
jgi:hypothetical protein